MLANEEFKSGEGLPSDKTKPKSGAKAKLAGPVNKQKLREASQRSLSQDKKSGRVYELRSPAKEPSSDGIHSGGVVI